MPSFKHCFLTRWYALLFLEARARFAICSSERSCFCWRFLPLFESCFRDLGCSGVLGLRLLPDFGAGLGLAERGTFAAFAPLARVCFLGCFFPLGALDLLLDSLVFACFAGAFPPSLGFLPRFFGGVGGTIAASSTNFLTNSGAVATCHHVCTIQVLEHASLFGHCTKQHYDLSSNSRFQRSRS